MAKTVTMPKLGFDMAEGTLVRWVKVEGDKVIKGDVLAEIETDKATVEVESPGAGTIVQLYGEEVEVELGKTIAYVAKSAEELASIDARAEEKPASKPAAGDRKATRKVVPNDGEYFTKTIVANGRHLAVWVNGYPVTDWEDDRPEGANARQQARLQAGTISLQAHDPTTNLDFRNIRVAELPAR